MAKLAELRERHEKNCTPFLVITQEILKSHTINAFVLLRYRKFSDTWAVHQYSTHNPWVPDGDEWQFTVIPQKGLSNCLHSLAECVDRYPNSTIKQMGNFEEFNANPLSRTTAN